MVGTHGRGFFAGYLSEPITTTSTNENKLSNLELRISPNPMQEEVNITFRLQEPQNLTIQVYDLEGKIVLQKVATKFASGEHNIPLSFNDSPNTRFKSREGKNE